MKKIALLLVVLLGFTACKLCDDPSGPPLKLAKFIEAQWSCTGQAALEKDVETWFASKGFCQAPKDKNNEEMPQGMIAGIICPILGSALQDYMVTKVPPSWNCDPSKVGANVVTGLVALCELAPF